jgi:hypothetical protein
MQYRVICEKVFYRFGRPRIEERRYAVPRYQDAVAVESWYAKDGWSVTIVNLDYTTTEV